MVMGDDVAITITSLEIGWKLGLTCTLWNTSIIVGLLYDLAFNHDVRMESHLLAGKGMFHSECSEGYPPYLRTKISVKAPLWRQVPYSKLVS